MPRQVSYKTQRAAEDIGQQLAAWRKLRGLTAQQVADRAGVTRQTVSRLERGDLAVGMGVFLNVCRALGILEPTFLWSFAQPLRWLQPGGVQP